MDTDSPLTLVLAIALIFTGPCSYELGREAGHADLLCEQQCEPQAWVRHEGKCGCVESED